MASRAKRYNPKIFHPWASFSSARREHLSKDASVLPQDPILQRKKDWLNSLSFLKKNPQKTKKEEVGQAVETPGH